MGKLISKPGDFYAQWYFSPPLKLPEGDIVALEIVPGNAVEISIALFGGNANELQRVMKKQADNPQNFRMHVSMRQAGDDPETSGVLRRFEIDRFTVLVLQEREYPWST